MNEKDQKTYGIILVVLAGVFIIGILSHWHYSTWQVIDWATILICGFIGFKLYFGDNKK